MSDTSTKIKESINLPSTTFPMKANLAQREPDIIAKWQDQKIYEKMVSSSPEGQDYIMADGPPYANGHIHMGHTLNKCLKDFVIKSKNMAGFRSPYIPGWDCHGLPIEHNITKKLGGKIKDLSGTDIRNLCRKEAMKWVDAQRDEFIRLGILGDWENPYLTLQSEYEAEEIRELSRILKNGTLFRGKKPVYWCIPLKTALAEAEIEYQNHKSPSIYVKFPMKPTAKFGNYKTPVYCIIWTTTPWTLPANQGIALHPDLKYGFYLTENNETFLIAEDLKEFFCKETDTVFKEQLGSFLGNEFLGEEAQHPWYDRNSKFVLGDHVTTETGTGCVHTAPGHGLEDYIVGLQYGLNVVSPVKEDGTYSSEVPDYQGLNVFEANKPIVADLEKNNRLVGFKMIEHSYPHCWRSKYPLIFRATSQWFIRMDDDNYNIRQKSLNALKDIEFVPQWGIKRLTAMIENRPDWCISRQRHWGVPIPVFYCKQCEEPLIESTIFDKVANAMENGQGIEEYFIQPESHFTNDLQCSHCNHTEFQRGRDILDVWFDSGVCHASVLKKRQVLKFPADLYLEGSDQHRGWFQTSLITSIAASGESPYKKLLTHNFVNDEKGRKMSKSLGNVVDPLKIIKQSGAELLRLWAASQDYGQDMNYSHEGFQRVTETYRRLRNTLRFMLGNLGDFDPQSDALAIAELHPLDRWALDRLGQFLTTSYHHYEKFEFYKFYHALNNFFTVDLSAHYLDIIKDRLYTAKTNGPLRRSCQTVLHTMVDHLLLVMAPITSFLSEEAYSHFQRDNSTSIFQEKFKNVPNSWNQPELREEMAQLFDLRSQVSKELEDARRSKMIGSSLEAEVQLQISSQQLALFNKYKKMLKEFFIVSQLSYTEGSELLITVKKAAGDKCPRCWHIANLKSLEGYGEICQKCEEALS